MLVLVDTGGECTLLHGNPEKFLGPEVSVDGYGGQSVKVKVVQLSLGIRCLPLPMSTLFMSPPFPSMSWVLTYSRICGYTRPQESFTCGCEW